MRKLVLLSILAILGCKSSEHRNTLELSEIPSLVEPVNVIAWTINRDMWDVIRWSDIILMQVGGCEYSFDADIICLASTDKKKDSAEARVVSSMLARRLKKLELKVDSVWAPGSCDTYHMVKTAANSTDSTGNDLALISVSPIRRLSGDTARVVITGVIIKHHCPHCAATFYIGELTWWSGAPANSRLIEKARAPFQLESNCNK